MDEIFRRGMKVDGSVAETSVIDEPDDFPQKKGETLRKLTSFKICCDTIRCQEHQSICNKIAYRFCTDSSFFHAETSTLSVSSGAQWVADCSKLAWSDGETEALLDIWGSEEIQENLKGCTKNKHIFIQISDVMTSQGYMRTPEQCQTRIKRLRANFRDFLQGRK